MKNKAVLISPLFNILVGILIIFFKGDVLKWVAIGLGALIAAYSINGLVIALRVKNNTLVGAYCGGLIFGILVIIFASLLVSLIQFVFGAILIIMGVVNLVSLSQNNNIEKIAVFNVIISIIFIVVGVLIMIESAKIYIAVGTLLIVNGILDLTKRGISRKIYKDKKKNSSIIDAEVKEL